MLRDKLILIFIDLNEIMLTLLRLIKKHAHAKISNKYIPRQASTAQ